MGDFIDLSVQNAFDRAKESGYDFIAMGISAKEIALDMQEKDWFLEHYVLEDIQAAVERYLIRNNI